MQRRTVLAAAAALGAGAGARAQRVERVEGVERLGGPLSIGWDRWGIPHVEAGSVADAFFGQGYAVATLRLWQMDLARRRTLGRLAGVFGPAFVPFDVAARTVRFRGEVAAEWGHHDPRVQALAEAWVAGVNARIGAVEADASLLPPEFVALDMRPERWAAEDLIRMRDSGPPNVRAEMRRAVLAAHGQLGLDALAMPLAPRHALRVPEGLDCARLHPSQLALLGRLSGPLPFARAVRQGALEDDLDAMQGSNGWVVAPGRSATGHALLANDPHLAVSVPGPRVIVHMRAPGLDAVGAGPAWRPGFQFGHTDRIAFGRTDFQVDQEDLFVLELNADGSAWRGPDGWRPIERVQERVAVRGAEDAVAEVALSALGPLVFEDRAARHALVVRSVQRESGPSVALEYVPLMLARNWGEYRAAIRTAVWGSNYLYADVEGNIGWQTGGRVPRRVGYDGLMPVPAAGPYRWDGVLDPDEMVGVYNPPEGWIATANQMPFPPGWPEAQVTSREWTPDDRYRRIAEVLGANGRVSVADCQALQCDTANLRARALRPVMAGLSGEGAAALLAWDGRVEAESTAAALFELWWAGFGAALRRAILPETLPAAVREALPVLHPHVLLALATGEDARVPERMALGQAALEAAWAQAAGRRWGELHQLELRHGLAALGAVANVHAGGSGGDGATVKARWWAGPQATQVSGGASFAAVIDLGDPGAARGINLPGQSGDPRSPHYSDLVPLWLADERVELTAAEIVSTLRLAPR